MKEEGRLIKKSRAYSLAMKGELEYLFLVKKRISSIYKVLFYILFHNNLLLILQLPSEELFRPLIQRMNRVQHRAGHSDRGKRRGLHGFRGVCRQELVADGLGNENRGGNGVPHMGFWVSGDAIKRGRRAVKPPARGTGVICSLWDGSPGGSLSWRGFGREKRTEEGRETTQSPHAWGPGAQC